MKKKLKIVSIGPGDPSLLNQTTLEQLRTADPLILRTDHHPMASWLKEQGIPFLSMDDLFDQSDDFDMLSGRISDRVWQICSEKSNTVFAVPDVLTDRTVDSIFSDKPEDAPDIMIIPGFSYADFYLSQCRGFLPGGSIRIISATDLLTSFYDPGETVLITEIDQILLAGDLKAFLSAYLDDETEIWLLHETGKPLKIPFYEMDRQKRYDHLTAVCIPATDYMHRSHHVFRDLEDIMKRLLAENGCPWDRRQTHKTLRPYVVEEAWEVVDAIDEEDYDHLAEELGDLLFQVVFHTSIASSFDEFSMGEVMTAICKKMIRRHPHVFHDPAEGKDPALFAGLTDLKAWEAIKQQETGRRSAAETLNDVSTATPSLHYAEKILRKIEGIGGFSYPSEKEVATLMEEAVRRLKDTSDREKTQQNIGFILLCISEFSRQLNIDNEILLHQTVKRIIDICQQTDNQRKKTSQDLKPLTFNDLGVY